MAAKAGVAMTFPKRAASALTAVDDEPDQRHQAHVHGGVSLADVASLGTEPTESPTSIPVPPPPERGFLSDCYGEVLNSNVELPVF